jgi:hypothetical protein
MERGQVNPSAGVADFELVVRVERDDHFARDDDVVVLSAQVEPDDAVILGQTGSNVRVVGEVYVDHDLASRAGLADRRNLEV